MIVKYLKKFKLYYILMRLYNRYNFTRIDNKLVFIETNLGRNFSDSPANIFYELYKKNPNYKYVLVLSKPLRKKFSSLKNVRCVLRLSVKYFYLLSKAKVIINNQNFPYYVRTKTNQHYFQTWHGTPLKKMLYDLKIVTGRSSNYIQRIGRATQEWDYLLTENEYTTKCFNSAFRHSAKLLEFGFPRSDCLFSDEYKLKNMDEFKKNVVNTNRKIILFAPTFREYSRNTAGKFYHDFQIDFDKMYHELSEEYIVVYKPHILLGTKAYCSFKGFLYEVTDYDINSLYTISDILITDYSSTIFDFAKISSKIIMHVPDEELYSKVLRGVYISLDELPFKKTVNTDEIIKVIKNDLFNNKRLPEINSLFSPYTCSNSTKLCVDFIDNILSEEDKSTDI